MNLLVVAEGSEMGGANEIAKVVKGKMPNADIKVCILGHIQRGGSPSCLDRVIASRMGYAAVECLKNGKDVNTMIGIVNNQLHYTPLDQAVKAERTIDYEWLKIVKILAS